ncbi:hypothetical protein CL689_04010 [Candidatus Saccharibacteria bacterium]|nr:hypothetical protein [Candidatus Saccharibacteria bacterium]|tara:strand:+ start:4673 stop:5551 length:879 start_codon:yes stop_codon:yes gene_type:complete
MKYNALVISGVVADVSPKELADSGSHQEIILENSEGSYAILYDCGDTPLSKETISGQIVTVPFELVRTEEFGTYKIKALEFLIKAQPSAADRIRAVSAAGSKLNQADDAKSPSSIAGNRRPAPSFGKSAAANKPEKASSPTGSRVAASIQNRLSQDLSTPVSDDPRVVIKDEEVSTQDHPKGLDNEGFAGDPPNWEEAAEAGHTDDLVAPQVASTSKPNFSSQKPGFNPPKPGAGRANPPASFGKKASTPLSASAPAKSTAAKPLVQPVKTVAPAARGFTATAKPTKPRPNF